MHNVLVFVWIEATLAVIDDLTSITRPGFFSYWVNVV